MMVPLLDEKQRSYNKAHKKCRCSIERAIRVLKSRFRCLCKKTIDYTVDGDVAAMIEKENEMALSRQHSEHTSDKEALKLGQEAREGVIDSFM